MCRMWQLIFLLLFIHTNNIVSKSIVSRLPGFQGDLPFKLETGYVGVGEEENVQLFYYFVESERNPRDDPLMLWLAGGPGCSAVRAFFYEIGPLNFNTANFNSNKPMLELNPFSWTKVANVIFLDQPVGTGFSYAKTWEASRSSDTLSATQIYDFLKKWLINHPKFLSNPLYISGTSYAGIILPNIVLQIYNGNEGGDWPPMNIKGYIIGNPLTNKNEDVNSRIRYAHRMALISDELYEATKENCHGNYIETDNSNALCTTKLQQVDKCIEKINFPQILENECASVNKKHNVRKWDGMEENPIKLMRSASLAPKPRCRSEDYVYSSIWANDMQVQKALHIREGTIKEWERCNQSILYSFGLNETTSYSFNVLSSVYYHKKLLGKNCRVLIYSGDHDMVVPYLGTKKWIHTLNLSVQSTWEPWFVQNQVAGYVETYASNHYLLTFATVKGAGHTGSEYKPKECLAMVDRWLAY